VVFLTAEKQGDYFAWAVLDKRTGAFRQIYKNKAHAVYYQRQNYILSAKVVKVRIVKI